MARADQIEKTISKIMKLVEDFTLDELLELRFDLEERVEKLKKKASKAKKKAASEPKTTVREEWKKCGKATCQCQTEGNLHGPYLYEYWKEGQRTRSRYLGKPK